jgi:hypothetical protein
MSDIATLDSENLEVEQFLQTPDAYRILNRGTVVQQEGRELKQRPSAPTYDKVIEAVLAGKEALEVVTRPLARLGQQWMVTLKNYPHLVVFISTQKSTCETVAQTRRLASGDQGRKANKTDS